MKKQRITIILTLFLCSFSLHIDAMDWLKNQYNTALAAIYNMLPSGSSQEEQGPIVPSQAMLLYNTEIMAAEKIPLLNNKIIVDLAFVRSKYQQFTDNPITKNKTLGDVTTDNAKYLLLSLYSSVSPLTDSKDLQIRLRDNNTGLLKAITSTHFKQNREIAAIRDGFITINNEIHENPGMPFVANALLYCYNAQTGTIILAKAGNDHAIVFDQNGKILTQTSDIYKPFMGMLKQNKGGPFPIMDTINVRSHPFPIFVLLATAGVINGYRSTEDAIKNLATYLEYNSSLEQAIQTLLIKAGQNPFYKHKSILPRSAILIKIDTNKIDSEE